MNAAEWRAYEEMLQSDEPTEVKAASRVALRRIADIVAEQRVPRWLLRKILEASVLAVLAGPRGTFKSFIALHWAMQAAIDGRCVVILSAEGAGLDRRVDAWMREHAPSVELRGLNVLAIERQLNLASAEILNELREDIRTAGISPDLILIDTYSKYAMGIDENDNAEVALFLAMLSGGLRDEFDATVLLVAHSGHGDAKRPRGASVLMANPDAEYIVERPDPRGMTVTVTRERFKDCESLPPLAYEAHVVDLGRTDDQGESIASLVLNDTDAPAPPSPTLRGKAQRQLLAALRERTRDVPGQIWSLDEMRRVGRELGLHKNSARAAVEVIAFSPFMTPTVGGYKLND